MSMIDITSSTDAEDDPTEADLTSDGELEQPTSAEYEPPAPPLRYGADERDAFEALEPEEQRAALREGRASDELTAALFEPTTVEADDDSDALPASAEIRHANSVQAEFNDLLDTLISVNAEVSDEALAVIQAAEQELARPADADLEKIGLGLAALRVAKKELDKLMPFMGVESDNFRQLPGGKWQRTVVDGRGQQIITEGDIETLPEHMIAEEPKGRTSKEDFQDVTTLEAAYALSREEQRTLQKVDPDRFEFLLSQEEPRSLNKPAV
jgi:hypothetical protein